MIGIYKIISPIGKIYIGQSINIERRFLRYKKLHCKTQILIYRSLIKYGAERHVFEVVCECEISELNDKERYYQDLYNCTGENGLNCFLNEYSGGIRAVSQQTKEKISKTLKGRIMPNSVKLKISKSNKGRVISSDHKRMLSISKKGKKLSESHISNLSKGKKGIAAKNRIIVLDKQTGVFYYSVTEACFYAGISRSTLTGYLRGYVKNKTSLSYC